MVSSPELSRQAHRSLTANILGLSLALSAFAIMGWDLFSGGPDPFWFSILAWSTAATTFITGIFCFNHYIMRSSLTYPLIGGALMVVAITDIWYVFVANNVVSAAHGVEPLLTLHWFTSRVTYLGLVSAAIVGSRHWSRLSWPSIFAWIGVPPLAFLLVAMFFTQRSSLDFLNSPEPWYLASALITFGVAAAVLRPLTRDGNLFSSALFLGTLPFILADLHAMASGSMLTSSHLKTAYALRVLGFMVPLFGIAFEYLELYMSEEQHRHELKETNAELEGLLTSLPDHFVRFTREGRVLDWIPGNSEPWPQMLQDRNLRECLPPAVASSLLRAAHRALESNESQEVEIELAGARRKWIYQVNVAGISETEVVGLARDITQRRELENETLRQQAELVETARLATLGEMAGGIAHEINNPLAIIQATGETLKRRLDQNRVDPERFRTLLDRILSTVSRVNHIVAGMRITTRDSSRDPFEPVLLDDWFASTLELCQDKLRKANVTIESAPVPKDIAVLGRQSQLAQVLFNLIHNAIGAMHSRPGPHWIRITPDATRDRVRIRISNSGETIPPEIRGRIMDPFFTTKEVGKGVGLGLSISRRIIEEHGGSLELSQTEPHTEFCIALPRTTAGSKAA